MNKDYDENDKSLIEGVFEGSPKLYEEALEEGRRSLIRWQDIAAASAILPELEKDTLALIERRLGYIPPSCVYIPFEPYLRGLISAHRRGALSDDQFINDTDEHIKLIRNASVKHGLYHKKLEFSEWDYMLYEKNRVIYKDKARDRVCMLLGYEPELKYSLEAEIKMRDFFREESHWEKGWYIFDFFIITIIKYREYLLNEGEKAADASPLISFQPTILK